MKVLLNEQEVEEIYGLNRRTLQRWRVSGVGPCFIRASRSIRYSVKDIEEFLSERKHTSTSEYGMQANKCSRETVRVERVCAKKQN